MTQYGWPSVKDSLPPLWETVSPPDIGEGGEWEVCSGRNGEGLNWMERGGEYESAVYSLTTHPTEGEIQPPKTSLI